MRLWLFLEALFCVAPLPAAAASLSFDLKDTEGIHHTAAELKESKAAVFAFVATDCPISNAYAPELARLYDEFSNRGIAFYAVHSDPSVSVEEARKHSSEFGYPFPTLLDNEQILARQTGATNTLEVAVISPSGTLLYRGRVDDRHVDFGRSRPAPLRQDLRIALNEILAGRPVSRPFTKVVGCAIPMRVPPASNPLYTYTRDIAPILNRNCVVCHRPGQVTPFSLLTYRDAARRAAQIARVTSSRYMPPWQPEPGYGRFQGERRLTDDEIEIVREWAASGAPEGDPAQAAPPPRFPEGWQLGRPDAIVTMSRPYSVSPDGPDQYHCFVLPLNLTNDTYVRAVEFHPGNRRVVHHALMFLDTSGVAQRKDTEDPEQGYSCFGAPGFLPTGALGGWTPGSSAIRMPDGAPTVVRKGTDLVLQLHFHPTGKPEFEQSTIGLYFTPTPPRKRLMDIALGSHEIDIPPGERAYKVRDRFTTPVDVEAIGIIPHAHYICKDMRGWAVLPDGTRRWLIWIRDWNFDWQEQYRYLNPLKLPAGTRLEMEFTYDNSEANPQNPSHPPKRVVWGLETTDEMAGLHVQVVPERASDVPELGQALWGKFMRSVGGGFYRPPGFDKP